MRSFLALVRKDLKGYFDQPTGYLLIVIFVAALSFAFFRSALLTEEASLRALFTVEFAVERPSMPWLLAIFVPAATMRLLAEEQRDGTLELLFTQPIRGSSVLLSKFVSGLVFVGIAILATLGIPISLITAGSLDIGAVVAQYVGVMFLAASFVSIGLFTSSLSRTQIVSFILGLTVTALLMIIGLEVVGIALPSGVASLFQSLSPLTHFSSIARGVIDLRDVLYFIALNSTFLSATFLVVRGRTLSHQTAQYRNLQLGTVGLIIFSLLVGWFGSSIGGRLDLTEDKVFTLSDGTQEILSRLDDILTVELFQSREPPVQIELVARDVNDFLEDFAASGGDNVKLINRYPNPDGSEEEQDALLKAQLAGVPPQEFTRLGQTEFSTQIGFLGLALTYADQRQIIPFVGTVDGFEYRVASLAHNMLQDQQDRKVVGFLTGHGEKGINEGLGSVAGLLAGQYNVLDVPAVGEAVPNLAGIDVLIIAGPTQGYSDEMTQALHAYLAAGGKAMVMVDSVVVDTQRLQAFPNQFSLARFVERYGVIVEDNLVFDVRSNEPISVNNVLRPYPFWVHVPTVDSKVAGGVESVLLPWTSSIGIIDSQVGDVEVIPLLRTHDSAAVVGFGEDVLSAVIDVSPITEEFTRPGRQQFENDVAVAIESKDAGAAEGERFRLVVVADSEWLTDNIVNRQQGNLALGLDLVGWLAQEDALADIRSKVVTERRLDFSSAGHENMVQYANIIGVPVLFVLVGAARYARRRSVGMRVYGREE